MTESPFAPPKAALEYEAPTVGGVQTRASMTYWDAYWSFFRSPKWGMNLLLAGVCVLIPILGIFAVQGWAISVMVRQHLEGGDHPFDFDFNDFTKYMGRGAWPFLAAIVLSLALTPLMLGATAPMIVAAQGSQENLAIAGIVTGLLVMVMSFGMMFVSLPIMLRASLMQAFSGVFSLSFVRDFVSKMWLEIFLSQLMLGFTGMLLGMVGYLFCGLGVYPAMALSMYATYQIHKQLYEVYLFRGGTPVEIRPDLAQTA